MTRESKMARGLNACQPSRKRILHASPAPPQHWYWKSCRIHKRILAHRSFWWRRRNRHPYAAVLSINIGTTVGYKKALPTQTHCCCLLCRSTIVSPSPVFSSHRIIWYASFYFVRIARKWWNCGASDTRVPPVPTVKLCVITAIFSGSSCCSFNAGIIVLSSGVFGSQRPSETLSYMQFSFERKYMNLRAGNPRASSSPVV